MGLIRAFERVPRHIYLPVAFFLVGLFYWYAAPNFEASDTVQHVGMVKWIAERGELPLQSADHENLYGQEASQPPLYYLLMAAVWNAFDSSDFEARYLPSPFIVVGDPLLLGNKNLVIYKQVYPPDLRGSSLALYVIRLLGLGMGAVTVGAVVQSARVVVPNRRSVPLLAGALTAFNPQFLFISASVSNDNLINMLAALITWQTLVMLRDGFRTRRSLLLALLLALAALTKLSGLVVGAAVALAAVWLVIRNGDRRSFTILCGAAVAFTLVIAGWWYARNVTLYDELFGTTTMLDNFGRRSISPWALFLTEFEGLRVSYWAVFGAFNIVVDDAFYRVMDGLTLIAGGGLILFVARKRRSVELMRALAFLALLLVLGAAMLMWWSTQTWASTGRLLFPYITSASLLLALGICALRIPPLIVALPMLAFNLLAPFLYIIPNYDHPPVVERLPGSATVVDAQWGDMRLTGYELPPQREWRAGDEIPLTFYWRSRAHSPLAYALALSLLDAEGEVITSFETWPGWGTMPHPWMELDVDYRDDYVMRIPADAKSTAELQLEIRWYVFPDGPELKVVLGSGEVLEGFRLGLGSVAGD
ncbi:MAG: glycosyltransferase family 39 protein [Chloroflexi bacterium]|nr:glycosyltransferase family 39 protein [Chloroflexota bacterium]